MYNEWINSSFINISRFDNYRIPNIKEFISGFKYEICDFGGMKYNLLLDKYIYYWERWNKCEVGFAYDYKLEIIEEALKNKEIRVKEMKRLNPIAIWSKYIDYGDWCYNYYIPTKEEFIEGFKYEFSELIESVSKKDAIKPILSIDLIVKAYWREYTVGKNKDHEHVQKWLESYLENGYIRVKINNMKEDLIKNLQKFIDKPFFYKELLEYLDKQKDILLQEKVIEKTEKNDYNALWDTINDIEKLFSYAKEPNFVIGSSNISVLKRFNLNHELRKKYKNKKIKSKYKLNKDLIKPWIEVISNLYEEVGNRIKQQINWIRTESKKKYIRQVIRVSRKSQRILKKITPKFLTVVDIIGKYSSRFLGIHQGYKPLHTIDEINHHLYNHQPEKSPNRLVYIATKDRQQIARLPWKEANEKIITQLADEPQWEYISKQEGKKLLKPNPGLSYIPNNIDKKYKLIPVEVEYIPQDIVRDPDHGKITYIDYPEETFTKWENQLVYHEGADNKWHPYKKSENKKSLPNKSKRSKRRHPGRIKQYKKVISEYTVTLTKHVEDSIGDPKIFIHKTFTTSEQKAVNQAFKKMYPDKTVRETIKPYYKAKVERSIKSNIDGQLKKDRLTTSFLEPKKHVLINTMKDDSKKVEELTTYKRIYDKNPFKKSPKKWQYTEGAKKQKKVIKVKRHHSDIQIKEKFQKYLDYKKKK